MADDSPLFKRYMIPTNVSVSQLLEDGVEAAMKDGGVSQGNGRCAPDEVNGIRQRIRLQLLLVNYKQFTSELITL